MASSGRSELSIHLLGACKSQKYYQALRNWNVLRLFVSGPSACLSLRLLVWVLKVFAAICPGRVIKLDGESQKSWHQAASLKVLLWLLCLFPAAEGLLRGLDVWRKQAADWK